MIRPLRKWHRAGFICLAIVLPLLLIAALWVRRPAPRVPRIPDALLQPAQSAGGGGAR